uniref:Tyrosine-protein phosphatase domain-containing protein n=1 Tax=Gongylonema pulchrum TaxID=637853 RepID=A0A183CYC9_9BILA
LPGLYVSGVCALKAEIVKEHGITMIVNATEEVPNSASLGNIPRLKLFLKDDSKAWVLSYLDHVCHKILKEMAKGGRVLIHSVQGVSRCAAVCLAFLTKYKFKTLRDAYEYLASVRPSVQPRISLWRQLISYEQDIKQTLGSVEIVRDSEDPTLLVPDVYRRVTSKHQSLDHSENNATTSSPSTEPHEQDPGKQSENNTEAKLTAAVVSGQAAVAVAATAATVTDLAVKTAQGVVANGAWSQKSHMPTRKNSLSRKFSPVLEPVLEVVEAAA